MVHWNDLYSLWTLIENELQGCQFENCSRLYENKNCETLMHFQTMLQRYKQLLANQRFIMMKLITSKFILLLLYLSSHSDSYSSSTETVFQQFLCISFWWLSLQLSFVKSKISPHHFFKGNPFFTIHSK